MQKSDQGAQRMFPALSLMERNCPPLKSGREPYWRAPITPPSAEVLTPSWNWHGITEFSKGSEPLTLDVNGSYIGAMTGATIGHSQLTNVGAPAQLPEPRKVPPGYYLISAPYWPYATTIVSPLGDSARLEVEPMVWVAGPTLVLLLELLDQGSLGDLTIHDAWIARVSTDFRSWGARLRKVRTDLLDQLAAANADDRPIIEDKYQAFKDGYGAAMSMMLTGEKCKTRRPDWAHTIYAQHAASQWRKAWRFTEGGYPLVRMGAVDEITILAEHLNGALERVKPPFRLDESGYALGAFKTKVKTKEEVTATTVAPYLGDQEDIL